MLILAACGSSADATSQPARDDLDAAVASVHQAAGDGSGTFIDQAARVMQATNGVVAAAQRARGDDVPADDIRTELRRARADALDADCGICAETLDYWIAELDS